MNPDLSNGARRTNAVSALAQADVQHSAPGVLKMKTFLVEDNATIRENLISTLEELTPVLAVGSADTAEEGAQWLTSEQSQWDLAIVDLFLKSGTGLGVLKACQQRHKCQKMVVFSNYATREMRMRCAELGADAVFDKSTEIDALLTYCRTHTAQMVSVR